MEKLLDQIFYGNYSPFDRPVTEREKASLVLDRLWRSARKQLGEEPADKLREQYEHLLTLDSLDDFRAGFRLGASLMLELLADS